MDQKTEEEKLAREKEEAAKRFEESPEDMGENDVATASPISAESLVAGDTDRPIADAVIKPGVETPPPPVGGEKKRGRPRLTPEQKAQSAQARAQKAPPSFNDLNGRGAPGSVGSAQLAPPRDYQSEAMQIFVPGSLFLGKVWGEHWGLKIDHEKKSVDLTEEQKAYVYSMGKWLEYEQFPPLNARFGFILHTCAYAGPKLKTDPTPEKLKEMWGWAKKMWNKLLGKK